MNLENPDERCLVQYNLRIAAAEKLRKKECIFTRHYDKVVSGLIDLPNGSRSEKETIKRKIVSLFPDPVLGGKA